MDSLGQKIRKLRKERRLTQQTLAEGLVTASMISQIEADRATPSPRLLESLAIRLGVDPSRFLEDVTVKTDQTQAYRKAKALMDLEQFEAALPLLKSLIDPVAPQFREHSVYQDLAECYEQLHHFDDAVNMHERIASIAFAKDDFESVVHAYFRLGRLERKRTRFMMARAYFRKSAALLERHPEIVMPLSMKIHTALGRVCLALDRHEEALYHYRVALSLADKFQYDTDKALIYHGMASLLKDLGQYDDAITATEQAITLYDGLHQHRNAHQCRINLAAIRRKTGCYEEALTLLGELQRLGDFRRDQHLMAGCYMERAHNWLALGQNQEAVHAASDALLLPLETMHRVEVLEILTDAYVALNKPELALRYLEQAIELASGESAVIQLGLHERHMRLLAANHQWRQAAIVAKEVAQLVISGSENWRVGPRDGDPEK